MHNMKARYILASMAIRLPWICSRVFDDRIRPFILRQYRLCSGRDPQFWDLCRSKPSTCQVGSNQ